MDWIAEVLVVGALVSFLYLVLYYIAAEQEQTLPKPRPPRPPRPDALERLKEQYASGAIELDEFERRVDRLVAGEPAYTLREELDADWDRRAARRHP